MSTGIDVTVCVSTASGSSVVTANGNALACTASDGTAGTVAVTHLALVDSPESAPFDYVTAGGFFALAFSMVVAVWMVSAGVGAVLDLIRRG
ncbi:hypothetical protein [Paraburkholderia humisilvae]|uniref:Uncharacterized protein n=1 Tax=Paraburkholderia humisilvae TaxID=627669 RepID=A0A6J5E7G2_9BURK|nr:hypothetical protein LMG29542_04358 [Paraburkholderia humisilvae]